MTPVSFTRDTLVTAATDATGFDDFGADTWQEGLDHLLDSVAIEADLNDIGSAIVENELVAYLKNRLTITAWRHAHPAVAEAPIERPIFIMGLPRTGTTILFDLLAQDPAFRAPLFWEVDAPHPPPRPDTYETDERIALAQATLDMSDSIIPGFQEFHPMGPQLAQECVRMTACDFRSMIFPTQYRVPTYNAWLLHDADLAPAYRWHRIYLQHLQSGGVTAAHWLLKSPFHLWHLSALMGEYPDAVIIQTHRDPLKVVASISALAAHLRRLASDHSSVSEAAQQYVDDVFLGLDRAMDARIDGTLAANQVVDVRFTDLMSDPFATINSIYDAMGLTLAAQTERRMREFLASNPGDGGGGGTRYTFVDTELDADELRSRSKAYQEQFEISSEPVQ